MAHRIKQSCCVSFGCGLKEKIQRQQECNGSRKGRVSMLIIEDNSVYEIDEECVRRKKLPKECGVYEKLMQEKKKEERSANSSGKTR